MTSLSLATIAIATFMMIAQFAGLPIAPNVNNVWQFLALLLVVGLQAWSLWLGHQNKANIVAGNVDNKAIVASVAEVKADVADVKTQTDGLTKQLVVAAGKQGAADVREEIRLEGRQDAKDERARMSGDEIPVYREPGK